MSKNSLYKYFEFVLNEWFKIKLIIEIELFYLNKKNIIINELNDFQTHFTNGLLTDWYSNSLVKTIQSC